MSRDSVLYGDHDYDENDSALFSLDYIRFLVEKMFAEGNASFDEIKSTLVKEYGRVNNSAFSRLYDDVSLSFLDVTEEKKIEANIIEVDGFLDCFRSLNGKDHNYLEAIVYDSISKNQRNTILVAAALSSDDHLKHENRKEIYYKAKFIRFLKNSSCFTFDSAIESISENNRKLSLECVIFEPLLLGALVACGMETINDLFKISHDVLLDSLALDWEHTKQLFDALSGDPSQKLIDYVETKVKTLDPGWLQKATKQEGIGNGLEGETLQVVGDDSGLTRERIRQIVKLVDNNISSWELCQPLLLITIERTIPDFQYISYEEALSIVGNRFILDIVALNCLHYSNGPKTFTGSSSILEYDSKLKVFYLKNDVTLEEIRSSILSGLSPFIGLSMFNSMIPLKQRVVRTVYSKRRNGSFMKIGENETKLTLEVLDETFPNGYHHWDVHDYQKLCEAVKMRYGPEFNLVAFASIRNALFADYIDIDKGSSKRRSLVAYSMSNVLFEEIKKYIRKLNKSIEFNELCGYPAIRSWVVIP